MENRCNTCERICFNNRHTVKCSLLVAAALLMLFLSTPCAALENYIDATKARQEVFAMNLLPGDSVFFQPGGSWAEGLPINPSGSYDEYLTLAAGPPSPPENLRFSTGDDPDPTPIEPGNHAHFDKEKVKPGVFHYRAYRTDAEIRADWTSMDKIAYGSRGSAYYDDTLDGAVIPIIEGIDEANSLRSSFTPVTGTVWVQWEMWVDQDFFLDLPIKADDGIDWVNTKLFRFANEAKHGCLMKYVDTIYASYAPWNGSKGFIFEGEDCGTTGADILEGAGNGDQWLRWTVKWDFTNKHLSLWITTMSGVTTQYMDEPQPNMTATHMDGAWPLLHSTSRDHHPDTDHPTYIFAFRNIIVSKNPISFN